jgi:peptidoglycan/xylan/chitin deacetylase (PgdA/CDA1 family)
VTGSKLAIIMYHYVRPLEQTRYPAVKARRLSDFKSQLVYVRRNLQPVTVQQLIAYFREGEPLPSNAALLTFDDGYLDHYTYVFPLLYDAGIQGAFFPVVNSARDGKLLDVNRIHLVLASTEDSHLLVNEINRCLPDYGISPDSYWSEYGKPSRFDSADVVYVKYMLQAVLPEGIRSEIVSRLFKKFVTANESTLVREWYMDTDQLRTMQRCGMYVGSHGTTHRWLAALSPGVQREEIEKSLLFLREVGSPVDDYWVLSYPSGSYNEALCGLLKEHHCSFGLTTEVGVADLGECNPLLLPRLDTNDLPIR